jgi:hypothetical protein
MDDLREAWDLLNDSLPRGWQTGQPRWDERRQEWSLYAWDATERPVVGRRTREWTAVHPTQAGVLRELARCVAEISDGRAPR